MNLAGINFCVIKNPINERKNPIIFLTRRGVGNLDDSIVGSEDYEKACFIINELGYEETDVLTFEKVEKKGSKTPTKKEIKDVLEKNGMKYSLVLEKNIKKSFELINSVNLNNSVLLKNNYIKTFNYKEVPPIGSRITLFFNLFIECKFNGEKCFVNLNGDFFSNKDDDTRNFLGMAKCDFIRVEDIKNTGKIIFKSCEKNSNLIKTIPINYAGHFVSKSIDVDKITEKTFVYYMMEIKDSLLPDNRITIEINNIHNFNDMLSLSSENKKQYNQMMNSDWNIDGLQDGLIKIYDVLFQKMQKSAEIDEFEKAAKIRDDAEYIKRKIEEVGEMNKKKLKYFNFLKKFHIK